MDTHDDDPDDGPDDGEGTAREQRSDVRGRPFEPGNPYRFPPGVSGNPNGRPKGLTRIVREVLEEIPAGDPENRPRLKMLVQAMFSDAMPRVEQRVVGEGAEARTVTIRRRGSYQHARELLDRGYGRVPLAIKVSEDEEQESFDTISVRVVTRDEIREMKRLSAKPTNGSGTNGDGEAA